MPTSLTPFGRLASPVLVTCSLVGVFLILFPDVAEARSRKPKRSSTPAAASQAVENPTREAAGPVELSLGWHESPEERRSRAQREREARQRLGPALETWALRWERDSRPLFAALERASSTLAKVSDRSGRNTCYPLETAARRLRMELPTAPERGIETEVRAALVEIELGAELCRSGLPTTAQRTFGQAKRRLIRAQTRLAIWLQEGLAARGQGSAP